MIDRESRKIGFVGRPVRAARGEAESLALQILQARSCPARIEMLPDIPLPVGISDRSPAVGGGAVVGSSSVSERVHYRCRSAKSVVLDAVRVAPSAAREMVVS